VNPGRRVGLRNLSHGAGAVSTHPSPDWTGRLVCRAGDEFDDRASDAKDLSNALAAASVYRFQPASQSMRNVGDTGAQRSAAHIARLAMAVFA